MKYIKYLSFLLIYSCSSPKDNKTEQNESKTVNIDSTKISTVISSAIPLKFFNYNKFNLLADSLISIIADEKLLFKCTIDTVRVAPKYVSPYKYLLQNSSCYIIEYRFYPGKSRSLLKFNIKQAIYPNDSTLNDAYSALKSDANNSYIDSSSGPNNYSPGLSYENDYVIKTNRQILWLNLPCPYSTKNVNRVKNIFLKSLNIPNKSDSIICWCGQPVCEK